MEERLTRVADELRKLEMELADAGCTEHADEVGYALEKVQGVREDLSRLRA